MISVPTLRSLLKTKPDQDGLIELLRDDAIAMFEAETGVTAQAVTDKRVFFDNGSKDRRSLVVPVMAVTAIVVREWGESSTEADASLVEADEYTFDAATARLVLGRGYGFERFVTATVTGGYAENAGPADIRRAVMEQVKFSLVRESASNVAIVSSSSKEGGSTTLRKGSISPVMARVIGTYRSMA